MDTQYLGVNLYIYFFKKYALLDGEMINYK